MNFHQRMDTQQRYILYLFELLIYSRFKRILLNKIGQNPPTKLMQNISSFDQKTI